MIDERGELGAALHGTAQYDLGTTADLFDGFYKAEGMQMALRAMAPAVIAVDELGGHSDQTRCAAFRAAVQQFWRRRTQTLLKERFAERESVRCWMKVRLTGLFC